MSQGDPENDDVERDLVKLKDKIQNADATGHLPAAVYYRLQYIQLTEFSGRYDEALVNFTWCIGTCDKDEELREEFSHELLWRFKWIINSLVKYPEVSRAQIANTYKEMTRWYDRAGKSHRAIHSLRMQSARCTGDTGLIETERERWLSAPEDDSKDCAACEASNLTESFLWENQLQKAVDVSAGLINGRQKCAEQPQVAHAHLMVPLFRLGEFDLARILQRKSGAKVVGSRERMQEMGEFTAFLTATDQLTRAAEVVQSILKELPMVRRGWDRLCALMGVRVFLMRLVALEKTKIRFRLPVGNPLGGSDDVLSVSAVLEWTQTEMSRLTGAFNARNGNEYVSAVTREYDDLLTQIRPYPRAADASS